MNTRKTFRKFLDRIAKSVEYNQAVLWRIYKESVEEEADNCNPEGEDEEYIDRIIHHTYNKSNEASERKDLLYESIILEASSELKHKYANKSWMSAEAITNAGRNVLNSYIDKLVETEHIYDVVHKKYFNGISKYPDKAMSNVLKKREKRAWKNNMLDMLEKKEKERIAPLQGRQRRTTWPYNQAKTHTV